MNPISVTILIGTGILCCMLYVMHRQLEKDKAFREEYEKYMSEQKVEISKRNDQIANIEKYFYEKGMLFNSEYKFSGAKIGITQDENELTITMWCNPNHMNLIERFVIDKSKIMEISQPATQQKE